jgi:predicted RNase H-like HicB family nuclease
MIAMRISVLIEPVPGNGYRARGSEPLGLIAEGATRDKALQKLRELIDERVAAGAEIVSIDLPEQKTSHTWLPYAGMMKDDSLVEEWKQAMAEYRRQVDKND